MKEETNDKIQRIKLNTTVYENFPKPGVKFYDMFSVVSQPALFNDVIDLFVAALDNVHYDKIFMLESRGFLLAVPLSLRVNKPCYPFRKKGKLPGQLATIKYDLQYGSDQIQIQKSSIKPGDKVILIDDVLATGGTMNAAIQLIQKEGATVERVLLFNVIKDLKGVDKLPIPKQKVFYIYQV